MSAQTMAWGWSIIHSGILENKTAAKLVLLKLADRADPEGRCWPGHQRTARDLSLSKTVVKESIRMFQQLNLLQVEHRKCDEGDYISNIYLLNLNFVPPAQGEETQEEEVVVGHSPPHPRRWPGGGALSAPPGARAAPRVGHSPPQGGAESAPESKREPVIQKKQQHARSRVPSPASAGDAAENKEKARRVRQSGLVTWYPDDAVECESLERQTPASELAAAVAAERGVGRDPLPGRVAARLLQQRQATQNAADAEQVEARLARLDAESRARGARDMQELMALKAHQTTQDRDS